MRYPMTSKDAPQKTDPKLPSGQTLFWAAPRAIVLSHPIRFYDPELDVWEIVERSLVPEGQWSFGAWTGIELLLWRGSHNLAFFP